MDKSAALFLTSPDGAPVLQRAANLPGDKAERVLALRRGGAVEPNVAALAAEIAVSRERAVRRGFADADRLFFTGDALAQATSPALSQYRAEYLAAFGSVADLCCGVGMDALAFAEAGATVVAVDVDPVRLLFARANAQVRGVADRVTFRQEPVEALGWVGVNAAFFDPARRTDAGRVSRHGDRYAPPLHFLHTIRKHVRGGCAKLSPALPDDVLRELSPSRVEFLSESRECKEACVWFGDAHGFSNIGEAFCAILLGGDTVRHLPGVTVYDDDAPAPKPGAFLLDPDPAIIRAPAWSAAFSILQSRLWSASDSYLATDTAPPETGQRLASAYRVVDALPYAPKRVKAWLAANGAGRIVVKKRHFPQESDAVARELGVSVRSTGREITLVLVREGANRFTAVLCEPVGNAG